MLSPLDKARVVPLGKATAPAASGTAGAAAAANVIWRNRARKVPIQAAAARALLDVPGCDSFTRSPGRP
jgi:hypothetical protein